MRNRNYYVYILTNWDNEVMYVGMTNNIARRLEEHRTNRRPKSFSVRYNIWKLVYVEQTSYVLNAISRDKELKGWRREKKNALVASLNPEWRDLAEEWEL